MSKAQDSLMINEIFFSIQGESSLAGWPTVFVRTTACNLRCTYCDTQHSYYEGKRRSFAEIENEIASHVCRHVCVTGGEPLLQPQIYPFMHRLCDLGYRVSLETSGSIDCHQVDPRVLKVIDVKTPDSGAADSFAKSNLLFAEVNTEFKFVICSPADFEWAENFCSEHQLFSRTTVFYSPAFENIDAQWLAKKILDKKSSARLQLQLHKYIWSPHTRGV